MTSTSTPGPTDNPARAGRVRASGVTMREVGKQWLLAAAVLVCLTSIAIATRDLFRNEHPATINVPDRSARPASKGDSPDVAHDSPLVGNLEARIDGLEREIANLREADHSHAATPSPFAGHPSERPSIDPEQANFEVEERNKKLRDYFALQSRDPRWASEYERQIAEVGQKHSNDTRVANVDCRTTVCEMEIKNPDEKARVTFLRDAEASLSDWAAVYSAPPTSESGGGLTTVVHVFRKGYPLPQL
jgi:hypothetical protein